jgi:hypothetical protein
MSIKRGQIAQNNYSTQLWFNAPFRQTGRNLRGRKIPIPFRVEKGPNMAPILVYQKSPISSGGDV